MSGDRHEHKERSCVDNYLSPSEQIDQLEEHIKKMKEDIKQLKKLEKHKEKIQKLEHEKQQIMSKGYKKHRRKRHNKHH